MKARELALIFAAISFLAVLAVTTTVSRLALSLNGMTILPGFADIRFMLNCGVSFSLLCGLGTHILAVGEAAIIIALCIWAYGTTSSLLGVAQGTIIGGAIYNTADRALHGGVFDFLVLRLGSITLFVCNAADIAISIGVVLIFVELTQEARLVR